MNRANRAVFKPYLSAQESALMYKQWSKAVEMSRGWLDATEIGLDDDDDEEVVEVAQESESAKPDMRELVVQQDLDNANDIAVGSESD